MLRQHHDNVLFLRLLFYGYLSEVNDRLEGHYVFKARHFKDISKVNGYTTHHYNELTNPILRIALMMFFISIAGYINNINMAP